MIELSPEQIAGFLRRSYTAVDGLWFMKVEERLGFEAALGIDTGVWKVLPRMQARMLKSLTKRESGIEALRECLTTRLALESYTFNSEMIDDNGGFRIVIGRCPWHDLMLKSGREGVAKRVGERICNTEYAVWAGEFGDDISLETIGLKCAGAPSCVFQFRH